MTSTPMMRTLGRSGIEVSAVGLGCWAIGGPWTFLGAPGGWSNVDDAESVRAIRAALDAGVTFFDTAANYGAGHSEEVLGQALGARRGDVVVATKFGYQVDEEHAAVEPYDENEEEADVASRVRSDLEASLRRLGTDYIDVFQLHVGGLAVARALEVREVLQELVAEGLVRTYGWSTGQVEAARKFADATGCGVLQHGLSVLDRDEEAMLELCHELDLGSINRSPLGMGLLTGKFAVGDTFARDDVRSAAQWHPGFEGGRPSARYLSRLDAVRQVLTSGGRSLGQGALGWIWARSPLTVPIPGFKTVAQVRENAAAMDHGPLTQDQLDEIEAILTRE